MENYHFLKSTSQTPTQISPCSLQTDILDQLNTINVETLVFIDNSFCDADSPNKVKNIKTQIFLRRGSVQDSQQSSYISNQVDEIKELVEQPPQINPMKRTMKRSQTCFRKDFQQSKNHGCKIFIKKANQAIMTHFESIRTQKSNFTSRILQGSKQYLRTIQVKYFKTNLSKVLFIDRNMTAIEFIGLALKEFKIEKKFDQSLYEYPNFTLAYQLETLEDQMEMEDEKFRKPIQRAKSFASVERLPSCEDRAVNSQLDISYGDMDDKTITIDYPAILNCKQVELVLNRSCEQIFGIDLLTIKMCQQESPEKILIYVEDVQTKGCRTLQCLPSATIESLFDYLNFSGQRKSSKDYYLRLKYSCIHLDEFNPLSVQMPISSLPIHWLVLECKALQEQSLPNQGMNLSNRFSKLNFPDDGVVSQNYIPDSQMKYDQRSYFSGIFSFKEFNLDLCKDNYVYPIVVGIDYFDLRIQYINQEQSYSNNSQILMFFTKIINDLFYNNEQRDKVIHMKKIKVVSMDRKQQKIHIQYKSSSQLIKSLCLKHRFCSDKTQESKFYKEFLEAYQKICKLMGVRKGEEIVLK